MEEKIAKSGIEELAPQESAEAKKWFEDNKSLLQARESHFSLAELHELATARKSWGEFWEMPKHLASCPACLDFFETLLKEDTRLDDATLDRMRKIHPLRMFSISLGRAGRSRLFKIAAAAAIFVMAGWLAISYFSVPDVKIIEGALVSSDGRQMSSGSRIPDESEFIASIQTSAMFGDGSMITISQDSQISILPTKFSCKTVQLSQGSVFCEIPGQKHGSSFKVLTPAGEAEAVGTKFSVESRSPRSSGDGQGRELKFMHPMKVGVKGDASSSGGSDSIMTVKVEEGAVIVRNRHGSESRIETGQTAVIRGGISVIDVFGGATDKVK